MPPSPARVPHNHQTLKPFHPRVAVVHGDADRLGRMSLGLEGAGGAGGGPAEVVLIHGAGNKETYTVGGRAYRDRMWEFIRRPVRP